MTTEQRDADALLYAFRRNIVVAASAGTGKTYRLTALYVLLTLGLTSMGERDDRTAAAPIGPERIVATTFSRAAAQEIATRVEHALVELAAWDGERDIGLAAVVHARLGTLTHRVSPAELRRRAAQALSRVGLAKIDTLHGVARRVVQRHALEVGLLPTARILDEEEAAAFSDRAVDSALGAALTAGGAMADAARALIATAGGVTSLRRQIVRLLDRLDEEGLAPIDLATADHGEGARATARELRRVVERLAVEGSGSLRPTAAELASVLARQGAEGAISEALPRAIEALFSKRLPALGKRLPADDDFDAFIGSLPGKSKPDRGRTLVAWLRNAPRLRAREASMLALLEDARGRLLAAKERAAALGFGDLLRISRRILMERPEAARSARDEAAVLLVDEFQDTSRVQRDLIYLLREDEEAALRRGPSGVPAAEDLKASGLFLVGDRKQSVYGFRGADVGVFSRIAGELAGREAAVLLALPPGIVSDHTVADFATLRESRRSGARILEFVNAFSSADFAQGREAGAPPRDFEVSYAPGDHLTVHAGNVDRPSSVVFLDDDGVSPEGVDAIVGEAKGAAREAHVAAAYVRRLLEDGRPAATTRARDVAILARRRSTLPLVELALSRLSIPYVVAGRALYDAPEVRDAAALLRLLLNPRDALALATTLRGPLVALSDTALALLCDPGRGLSPALLALPSARPVEITATARLASPERERLESFRARFIDTRGALLRLPPDQAIAAAITAFDLDRTLAALPRAEARLGNLDRLVSIARRQSGTLSRFVRWLDRRIRDDADEAEAAVFSAEDDAVRLTTIHASKGLSFPVVVVVDVGGKPRGDYPSLGFLAQTKTEPATFVVRHYAPRAEGAAPLATAPLQRAHDEASLRAQAERRRLTYVAITRAERCLVVVGTPGEPQEGSALATLRAQLDLGGDLMGSITSIGSATALLAEAVPAPPPPQTVAVPFASYVPVPAQPPPGIVRVPARALAVFAGCPRRFELRILLGIEEPAPKGQADLFSAPPGDPPEDVPPPLTGDANTDGLLSAHAAHRVLAAWPRAVWGAPADLDLVRDRLAALGLRPSARSFQRIARALAGFLSGEYARAVATEKAVVRLRDRFVLELPGVLLEGVVDLVVTWPDGGVDLIDLSAPEGDGLALRVAALAAGRTLPGSAIRIGAIAGDRPPRFLDPTPSADGAGFEASLTALARRFLNARYQGHYEAASLAVCQGLRCGFIPSCGSRPAERSAAQQSAR